MRRGTNWLLIDICCIIFSVAILISSDFRFVNQGFIIQSLDFLIYTLMFIAITFGVYCLYTRKSKVIAIVGFFSGLIGLIISFIISYPVLMALWS